MYPNLQYAFNDLFGVNIGFLAYLQSFGFLVAISFLLANYTMTLEMKRKEKDGILKPIKRRLSPEDVEKQRKSDIIGSAFFGFLIGFKLIPVIFFGTDGEPLPDFLLSLKGNWLFGLLLSAGMGAYRYYSLKKEPLPKESKDLIIHPHQLMGNLTIAAAVSGLLGAKVFHNLENWSDFIQDPIGNLLAFSGLTFYGGLIVGGATVLYIARKNGIHWRQMIDIGAPAMMLAYGVGRLGCHISGDGDWGIVNLAAKPSWFSWAPDWLWAYQYPHNVLREGVPIDGCEGEYCFQLAEAVYPTPLYEAAACITLFFVLWGLRKRLTIPGMLFSIYLVMNGMERFLIEKIRVNNKMDFLGMNLTQAELISFSLILAGIVGIIYFRKNPVNKT